MSTTLDNLKKIAKRWLKALRSQDNDAQARLRRAYPGAPTNPALRDVQHALAREHGHESWEHLRRAVDEAQRTAAAAPDLTQYDNLAKDLLAAYHANDPTAFRRIQERFGDSVTLETLRTELERAFRSIRQQALTPARLDLSSIRLIIAEAAGFGSWEALIDALRIDDASPPTARPVKAVPESTVNAIGMLWPVELRATLPMELQDGRYATTTQIWNMLAASHAGDLAEIKTLVAGDLGLVRCEYNYMPPLHLAVREGHLKLVRFLLEQGAYDPNYVSYPYNEPILTIAEDRGYTTIAGLLREYHGRPVSTHADAQTVHGVGTILFPKNEDREKLEKLVGANALQAVENLVQRRPELVSDQYIAWSEGILSGPANRRRSEMIELLMRYGARVPDIAKWGRAYYFKHYDIAALLLERGMNPNHMTWHRTTLLHDMAWEGDVRKVRLLLDHGADIDAVDDEFRSTPLGFAARWGRREIVAHLIERGADVNKSGAPWANPLAWAQKKGHVEIEVDLRFAGAR